MVRPESAAISPLLRPTTSANHQSETAFPPGRRSRPSSVRSVSSRSGLSSDGTGLRDKPYAEHLDAVYDSDDDGDHFPDGSGDPEEAGSPLLRHGVDARKTASRWKRRALDKVQDNAGLCLIAGSQALFACMNVSVKILQDQDADPTGQSRGGGLPVLELIAIRMSITLLGCISWLRHIKDPHPYFGPPEVRKMLALRGFIGFFGLSGMYQSLKYLSVSDATTLSFLTPTTTALLGYLFLREPFTRKECTAGLISLAGVILIARPAFLFGAAATPSPHARPITVDGISRTPYLSHQGPIAYVATPAQRMGAVGFALMGVAGSSGAYTMIRAIGKRATPFHSIAYFSFYCVVVSIVGMIVFHEPLVLPAGLTGWLLILVIGVFGLGAQVLVTMGLQREKAGRGTLATYTQLLFATILERIIFEIVPSWLSVLGTMIILSAALWVALSKKESKPADVEAGPSARGTSTPTQSFLSADVDGSALGGDDIPMENRPGAGGRRPSRNGSQGGRGLDVPVDRAGVGRRASVGVSDKTDMT